MRRARQLAWCDERPRRRRLHAAHGDPGRGRAGGDRRGRGGRAARRQRSSACPRRRCRATAPSRARCPTAPRPRSTPPSTRSPRRPGAPGWSRSSGPSGRRRRGARSWPRWSAPTASAWASRPRPRSTRARRRTTSPGRGRRTFEAAGARFAVAICHEAFRYPEISRDAALAGAQILFVPHFVVTDDGSRPSAWCEAATPYNEKALLCRALENTVYVAQANNAGPDQGSATAIVAPDGTPRWRWCPTARRAWRSPTSTCRSRTPRWPGAGRPSAASSPRADDERVGGSGPRRRGDGWQRPTGIVSRRHRRGRRRGHLGSAGGGDGDQEPDDGGGQQAREDSARGHAPTSLVVALPAARSNGRRPRR